MLMTTVDAHQLTVLEQAREVGVPPGTQQRLLHRMWARP
jgi:hypothetical protein